MEENPEYEELVLKIARADEEFGKDLWLIAERIVLDKLTRASDRKAELKSIIEYIQEKGAQAGIPYSSRVDDVESANLASGFSAAVDLMEKMNDKHLYALIAWLRNEVTVERPLVEYQKHE